VVHFGVVLVLAAIMSASWSGRLVFVRREQEQGNRPGGEQ